MIIYKRIGRTLCRRQCVRFNTFRSIDRVSADNGIFHRIARSHPDNFLNTSLLDTTKDSSSIFRIQNNDNNILINHFFESLLRNDFLRSRVLLNKLKKRSQRKENVQNVNVYYSCLMLLLAHLLSNPKLINIHNTKLIIDDLDISFNHDYKKEIKIKLVCCLLHSYINVENKALKYSISKYIKSTFKKWGIDSQEYIENFPDAKLLDVYANITGFARVPIRSQPPRANNTIDSFKNDGFLSYKNLCKYIATRFDLFDGSDRIPLYELYDSLSPKNKEEFMEKYHEFNRQKQISIESNCLDLMESPEINKRSNDININRFKLQHSKIVYSWYEINLQALNSIITKINKPNFKCSSEDETALYKYKVYLNLLPKRSIVTLIISNLLSRTLSSELGYVKVSELSNSLGMSFKRLILKDSSLRDIRPYFMKFFHEEDSIVLFSSLINIFMNNCKIPKSCIDSEAFTQSMELIDPSQDVDPLFMENSSSELPSFIWSYLKNHDGPAYKKTGVVKIHPYLLHEFKSYGSLFQSRSLYLPMLCSPKPWTSPVEGGYLSDLKPVINTEDLDTSLVYLNKAHKTGQLKSLYNGLDLLGSTAWAINSSTLKVLNQVMDIGKGFLKIPPSLGLLHISVPEEPKKRDYISMSDFNKASWKYKIEKGKALQDYHAIKSQRIELNLIQDLANAFDKNGDIFYLPHNVDFRGRAYPMVSLLTHYQDDLVRSLLMFWNAKPLGPNGFQWLKYQLAGVYGKDKLSMSERLNFIDTNIELIIDSAENPLEGSMWWKSGEKPWQTLSLCFEIQKIISFSQQKDNKIEDYLCRIPIHQDGSCNGLQHYAALGKDREGGKSVNLFESNPENPVRNDVYTEVLNIVKSNVIKHSQDTGNQYHELANLSLLILSRKVVKQTVMTSVYGVTRHGATLQINNRIRDLIKNFEIRLNDGNDIPLTNAQFSRLKDLNVEIANYLASMVLSSITKLFSGAKLIQDWLLHNCFRIINSFDLETFLALRMDKKNEIDFFNPHLYKPMMWTSMSGFPVIQLYKHTKQKSLPTSLQSIVINKPSKLASIDIRKQLNAVAPNFIHSIDSIHMLMTCIAAKNSNIPFISVHDSFWTLPCDVDELSRLIREQFVRLHCSNIIENMREDMIYTTRNSFQLVYVNTKENEKFTKELNNLRSKYFDEPFKFTKKNYNRILYHELKIQAKNYEDFETPLQLLDKFNPRLYFKSKSSSKHLSIYDYEGYDQPESHVTLSKAFVPILVPVKILNKPPTGTLDINRVLDSVYFFS